jgi:hypothetical protein
VRTRTSYAELRHLYQTATAVLLPITSRNHAAGQTSLLEAVACGAPVVISEGRTGAMLNGARSLLISRGGSPDEWIRLLGRVRELASHDAGFTEAAARHVRTHHHPAAVEQLMCGVIRQAVE